jgi:hypothetical protein
MQPSGPEKFTSMDSFKRVRLVRAQRLRLNLPSARVGVWSEPPKLAALIRLE